MSGLFPKLFPQAPRDFPFRRVIRTGLRTAHILTGGTLLAGHIFNQPPGSLMPWLLGTLISGGLLLLTDLHASFAVLCEVRGLAVVVKLGLVALVALLWDVRVWLLIAALAIGVVCSHMPGRFRHKVLLLRQRVVPDERKG